jgi:hypothetical protein
MTMPDSLEQGLREAMLQKAAQLDPDLIARLRSIDYRPRRHRLRRLPAVGAVTVVSAAASLTAIISIGASAPPAFAGWQPTPTAPAAGQLAQAAAGCGQGLGTPVITDSRGPYTASIYADATSDDLCLDGDGISMASTSTSATAVSVGAGQIELSGGGRRDSAGDALTVVDGRVGAGVSAVTIDRADGSSVQATVEDGWYLAWWPGIAPATNAAITASSGDSTVAFPSAPPAAPACPAGGQCSSSYSYSGGPDAHAGASVHLSATTSAP